MQEWGTGLETEGGDRGWRQGMVTGDGDSDGDRGWGKGMDTGGGDRGWRREKDSDGDG